MNAFIKANEFKKIFIKELPNAEAEIKASMQINGALLEQDYFIEVFKDE